MGIAVRQGREFAWSDRLDTERVAILSHTLAAKLFPNGDGLGQRIRIGTRAEHERILVAGIVDDARLGDRRDPTIAAVYLALLQEDQYTRQSNLLVRYKAGARANIADIRRTVESLGYESILYAHPLSEVASFAILQEQLTALLGAFFGGLALLVAAVGVYGLMSYTVAARIPEFGVRMALGALPSNIVLGVLREALALTAIGAVGGLAAASLTGRVVQSWVFGISPHDLLTLSLAPVAVISIAMIAALLPAIRAARRDPMSAL